MGDLKYGHVKGAATKVECGISASQAFSRVGGGFVKRDTSTGHVTVCSATDEGIYGWAEPAFGNLDRMSGSVFTSSSTAGLDRCVVTLAEDGVVFRIPADAAPAITNIGKACDLIVASSVQKADIGENAKAVLRIVDVTDQDIADQTVQVCVNAIQAE